MRAIPIVLGATLLLGGCQKEVKPPLPAPPEAAAPQVSPCVYFKALRSFLPKELPGYRTERDEGSSGKYGEVSVSEAERVFAREGGELAVRIVDTTLSAQLAERIRAAAQDAQGKEASDPTAPLLLGTSVGFVRYDPAEPKAEANLLVADRFVVAVTSRGFEGTAEVRKVALSLDLAGLSKLR